jgi:hypothetical protein
MKVLMYHQGNLGYAADQIENANTLADLRDAIEDAIDRFGKDAEVVLFQTNNGYGANFGKICTSEDIFQSAAGECEECGEELNGEGECEFNHDQEKAI